MVHVRYAPIIKFLRQVVKAANHKNVAIGRNFFKTPSVRNVLNMALLLQTISKNV
jgi:hypothetical protein